VVATGKRHLGAPRRAAGDGRRIHRKPVRVRPHDGRDAGPDRGSRPATSLPRVALTARGFAIQPAVDAAGGPGKYSPRWTKVRSPRADLVPWTVVRPESDQPLCSPLLVCTGGWHGGNESGLHTSPPVDELADLPRWLATSGLGNAGQARCGRGGSGGRGGPPDRFVRRVYPKQGNAGLAQLMEADRRPTPLASARGSHLARPAQGCSISAPGAAPWKPSRSLATTPTLQHHRRSTCPAVHPRSPGRAVAGRGVCTARYHPFRAGGHLRPGSCLRPSFDARSCSAISATCLTSRPTGLLLANRGPAGSCRGGRLVILDMLGDETPHPGRSPRSMPWGLLWAHRDRTDPTPGCRLHPLASPTAGLRPDRPRFPLAGTTSPLTLVAGSVAPPRTLDPGKPAVIGPLHGAKCGAPPVGSTPHPVPLHLYAFRDIPAPARSPTALAEHHSPGIPSRRGMSAIGVRAGRNQPSRGVALGLVVDVLAVSGTRSGVTPVSVVGGPRRPRCPRTFRGPPTAALGPVRGEDGAHALRGWMFGQG